MSEKKPNLIFINNIEYDHDSLTDEQKTLFSHCVDLDRKINSAGFALDQLKVGKDAFIKLLETSLVEVV